jgi:hypothetical protein
MGNLTKVNDTRVKKFVDWSQARARSFLYERGEKSPTIVRVNHIAWLFLKEVIRGDDEHGYDDDYDAAAAEHYMFIRYVAGRYGDPACYGAPTAYAAAKLWHQLRGTLSSREHQAQKGHPVLPANPYIVRWGNIGVKDGLADYKSVTSGSSYNPGSAVEGLALLRMSDSNARQLGDYATRIGQYVQKP